MAHLEVENLKTYYYTREGVVRAVDGLSFSLDGESLGVVGESGCGKSTLGLSLLRLVSPGKIVEGSFRLDGADILAMDEDTFRREVRWRKISMVFQGAMNALSPVYTVGQQVAEPLIYHAGLPSREAEVKVIETLEEVGLHQHVARRYPHELSGGMKQRVVIAMALVLRPRILVADEPTTALDVVVQAHVINLLKRLKREVGISVILLTHDLSIISELADRVGVMYAGEFVELGVSGDIYLRPRHPYTQKLLRAVPRLRGEKGRLEFIPGAPPNLINPAAGCRFHPRCPHVMDICKSERPRLMEVQDHHTVACHLYGRR